MIPIYLDYNATTPIHPAVADAMQPFLQTEFGNPSSSHAYGVRARESVEHARQQVADAIAASPKEIVFTSGGTELNNYAIRGAALASRERGDHIITTAVEHPAVTEVCRQLEREGFRVTVLPVDGDGLVEPGDVERAITPETILITVMHANNEVGTVMPIAEISRIAAAARVTFHTDAAQSLGKIPVEVDDLGVDLLSIAGHKLYGPKGVGALYVRGGTVLEKLMHGADHERDRRPGTENIMGVAGLGRACELVRLQLSTRMPRLRRLRDQLHDGLLDRFPDLRLNGHPERRLPNTLSVCFRGVEANAILDELTDVAASGGAACHSGTVNMSATLRAMGVPEDYAMGTIRFSTGRLLSEVQVDRAVKSVSAVVERIRG